MEYILNKLMNVLTIINTGDLYHLEKIYIPLSCQFSIELVRLV